MIYLYRCRRCLSVYGRESDQDVPPGWTCLCGGLIEFWEGGLLA